MKRFAERYAGTGMRPHRGFLAPCARCGLVVVHWANLEANHMHRRSKLCRDLAKAKHRP